MKTREGRRASAPFPALSWSQAGRRASSGSAGKDKNAVSLIARVPSPAILGKPALSAAERPAASLKASSASCEHVRSRDRRTDVNVAPPTVPTGGVASNGGYVRPDGRSDVGDGEASTGSSVRSSCEKFGVSQVSSVIRKDLTNAEDEPVAGDEVDPCEERRGEEEDASHFGGDGGDAMS